MVFSRTGLVHVVGDDAHGQGHVRVEARLDQPARDGGRHLGKALVKQRRDDCKKQRIGHADIDPYIRSII